MQRFEIQSSRNHIYLVPDFIFLKRKLDAKDKLTPIRHKASLFVVLKEYQYIFYTDLDGNNIFFPVR